MFINSFLESKCDFFKMIKYLGHIIDKNDKRPDAERATATKDMPAPQNVSALQSFLGLANYYQVFIPNTHNLHTPLNELLKKDKDWEWTPCYILTFWPGQKCHSKVMHRKEVTHSNGSYERKSRGRKLADEMGRAKKFPWYTHRLMHRKRVTCELHDSYFRLMTIKHSISKIEWAIEWAWTII